jgi:hypothetical protein
MIYKIKTTGGGETAPQNINAPYNTYSEGRGIDPDKLEFPVYLADIIGLRKETISYWKKLGCRFVGRKTSVRWVREFMNTISGGDNHGIA